MRGTITAGPNAQVVIPPDAFISGCEDSDGCYIPAIITIETGGTVSWHNQDEMPHTVTSGTPLDLSGLFDSGLVEAGDTFSHRFDSIGVFHYFCFDHPWMTGTVVVGQDQHPTGESWKRVPESVVDGKFLGGAFVGGGTLNALPALADIDDDGDQDLFVGIHPGTVNFYLNRGNALSRQWAIPIPNYNNIGVDVIPAEPGGTAAGRQSMAFVDIDADQDLDLFVGNQSGSITLL